MNISLASIQIPEPWHEGGLFMGMHWAWWLFVAGTLVVLIWALWLALAEGGRARHDASGKEAAEEALRRRFAQGEINEEQFGKMLHVLRGSR